MEFSSFIKARERPQNMGDEKEDQGTKKQKSGEKTERTGGSTGQREQRGERKTETPRTKRG
jgi:hypothetical protein